MISIFGVHRYNDTHSNLVILDLINPCPFKPGSGNSRSEMDTENNDGDESFSRGWRTPELDFVFAEGSIPILEESSFLQRL
jgi:hypothetical protein